MRAPIFALMLSTGCAAMTDSDLPESDAGASHAAADAGTIDPVMDAGILDEGTTDLGARPIAIPASPQRPGDPASGYTALVNGGYVGCGIPASAYRQVFPSAPLNQRLPGRNAANEDLAYDFNQFVTASGIEVVHANCLSCHASFLNGELVIGLGDANRDFTSDPSQAAEAVGLFVQDPAERLEWRKWADRVQATAPYIQMPVIGTNPADNLAAILFAHRDPATLAWNETPLVSPPTTNPPPVDVPPWWRMKKKNALYYSGAGQGDFARLIMTASVMCVDSVDEATQIDSNFVHVRAYLDSIEAPAFPNAIDEAQAAEGKAVFETHCSRCHGTYGDQGDSYPNLLIPLELIGTDPLLADGASGFAGEVYRDWFESSFYGEISALAPYAGYVAPPLDGIWATAPYLHNGSVPDIQTLLNCSERPRYWTRDFNSTYDVDGMRYAWEERNQGHSQLPAEQKRRVYDTTLPGYSNGGHTYGDALSEEERSAVIEYLKTL